MVMTMMVVTIIAVAMTVADMMRASAIKAWLATDGRCGNTMVVAMKNTAFLG